MGGFIEGCGPTLPSVDRTFSTFTSSPRGTASFVMSPEKALVVGKGLGHFFLILLDPHTPPPHVLFAELVRELVPFGLLFVPSVPLFSPRFFS